MVNWSDPKEIQRDSDVFLKLIYSLFGLYIWELFTTCDFEWSLITKKREFRWPLVIFFFLCRYCILFAIIGLIISFSVTSPINCNALSTFNSWTGNMAILTASTSLMIRTIALWERKLSVVIPLGIFCLGHWGLLYRGMFIVHAVWDDRLQTCVVSGTNPVLLKGVFFYTMTFDFVILCYTAVALMQHTARTGLWQLLFRDGLVYFLVSFTTNAVPAILNTLDLNPIMNIIATVPAAGISSIAACRAVMRLLEFSNPDVFVHSSSNVGANIQSRRSGPYGVNTLMQPPKYQFARPEVHVTTEHISMAEFQPSASANEERSSQMSVDLNEEAKQAASFDNYSTAI